MDGPAGAQKLAWDIPALKADAANGYLVTLVAQAKSDGGRTLPLVDRASLATAKQEIEAGGHGLTYFARVALDGGNLESADKLAGEALNRNPNDNVARAIKETVAAKKAGKAPAPADAAKSGENPLVGGEPGDLSLQGGAAPPPDGAVAATAIHQARALEEQWQKDVQSTINKARGLVAEKPGEAENLIQAKINDLAVMTELRAEIRDRLMGMLRTARREIKHRAEELTRREQERIREYVARREQEMTNLALARRQSKVKQLMDRYDALMAEGRCRLAEEAASEAEKVTQGCETGGMIIAAAQDSRFRGACDDIMAVRVAKQKGFVDAIYRTEHSHVPAADDPPIVYPDGEFWRDLTARRKDKYSSTDLSRRSPAEKKIEEALKQPTQIEFVETPLRDVVDYLKDLHHIEIQLDAAALKDAGLEETTPVTKNLKGISLRSALKLLLDDLQLKYVIHNEVLLITSPAKVDSEEYMTAEVYPLSDLVLPIKDLGFKGGFGGMGQGNTMGGRNGQTGNGMMPGMGNGNMMPGMGNGNMMPGMGNGNMMPGMGNGNMMPGMGNGNMVGNPMGNGMFNVPREVLR
jgi:hypothetical protein